MNPAISIIVPVYNIDIYIRKCLDSILDQTFTNFEVIVVNDGSTDNSSVICDEYAKRDKRIKVIHQSNGGVSSTRNAGVKLAKGDYIGFVDGDDYIEKHMYETLLRLCRDTGSEISICKLGREINGELINETGAFYVKELTNEGGLRELFKGELYRFSLCNKLFHKSCFNEIQFPAGRIHEDLSTTYKLFSKANKSIYVNYIGYIYVKQKNSILTTTYYEKRLDAFIGWNEIITFMWREYPQLYDSVYACFTYSCVDHMYEILNQIGNKEVRKKYLYVIQESVQMHYKDVIKINSISLKNKYIITLLNCNTSLLMLNESLKNIFINRKKELKT